MTIVESRIREEIVYAAGIDLDHACQELARGNSHDTPQDAYNSIGYFEERENTYEVFEFNTTTRVQKVEPPYTKR